MFLWSVWTSLDCSLQEPSSVYSCFCDICTSVFSFSMWWLDTFQLISEVSHKLFKIRAEIEKCDFYYVLNINGPQKPANIWYWRCKHLRDKIKRFHPEQCKIFSSNTQTGNYMRRTYSWKITQSILPSLTFWEIKFWSICVHLHNSLQFQKLFI